MIFVFIALVNPYLQLVFGRTFVTSPQFLYLAFIDLLAFVAIHIYHVQKPLDFSFLAFLRTVVFCEVLLGLLAAFAGLNSSFSVGGDSAGCRILVNVALLGFFAAVCDVLISDHKSARAQLQVGPCSGPPHDTASTAGTRSSSDAQTTIAKKNAEIAQLKKDHRAATKQAGIAHANSITALEQQIENKNAELKTLEEKFKTTMESERSSATDLLENAIKEKNAEIAQLKRDHLAALAQARVDGEKEVCRHPLFKEAMATLKAGSDARADASNLLTHAADTIKKLLAERAALLTSSVASRQKDKENVDSGHNAGGDPAVLRPEAASTTDDTAALEFGGKVTAVMRSGCSVPEHRHFAPESGTETPAGEEINGDKELCSVPEHKKLCRDSGHDQMKADLIEAAGFIDYVAHALENMNDREVATLRLSVASRQKNKENVNHGHKAGNGPATLRKGASSTIDDTAGLEFQDLAKLQVNHSLRLVDGSVTIEENVMDSDGDGGELRLRFVSEGGQERGLEDDLG